MLTHHTHTHTRAHTHAHTLIVAETGYWYKLGWKYCEKRKFFSLALNDDKVEQCLTFNWHCHLFVCVFFTLPSPPAPHVFLTLLSPPPPPPHPGIVAITFALQRLLPTGYGARWTADGSMFRGFLEPQMEGGHDAGWRHWVRWWRPLLPWGGATIIISIILLLLCIVCVFGCHWLLAFS